MLKCAGRKKYNVIKLLLAPRPQPHILEHIPKFKSLKAVLAPIRRCVVTHNSQSPHAAAGGATPCCPTQARVACRELLLEVHNPHRHQVLLSHVHGRAASKSSGSRHTVHSSRPPAGEDHDEFVGADDDEPDPILTDTRLPAAFLRCSPVYHPRRPRSRT